MSAKDQGPAFAEEVLLHLHVFTTEHSRWTKDDQHPHMRPIGRVSADLGLERPPDFTNDEMQDIMYAAKQAAIKCLFARGRRVKRKRKSLR